ncbi:hypothetical protein MHPYR_180111 [uncultured Mycobacterium sp.]|uniref:Uncharacterized protein n=1 Tax=uncultured Mycobacterium sp. TaxID=171292 RepID=A0A1Y5P5G8_9MYCO|nr:hypothetical protein MHPYR_180111 [uncultured Mycobacterium sp.]
MCMVDQCGRPAYGNGLCNPHWQRQRRGKGMELPIRIGKYAPGAVCSVDGCDRTGKIQRGFCNAHYIAWRKYGDPLTSKKTVSRRGDPEVIPHGTASGYSYHHCRCADCRHYKRGESTSARMSDPDKAASSRHESYMRNRGNVLAANKAWNARHREAFNNLTARSYRRHQLATRANAHSHYRRWTSLDDMFVMRTDLTTREIAQVLGRSIASVRSRRSDLRKEQAA